MMRREIELQMQRAQLRARIAQERAQLTRQTMPVAQALDVRSRVEGLVDRAKSFVVANPLVVAGVVAGLVVFKPRTLLRLSQQGLVAWRTWRSMRTLLPASLLSQLTSFLR